MKQLLSLLKNVGSVMLLIKLKIFAESIFVNFSFKCISTCLLKSWCILWSRKYRGADKSLARPGRKQATATEDFDVHISYL